jgi:hypothetical protein
MSEGFGMSEEKPHLWRIDGIEEGVARVEEDGERMISVPRHLLPAAAREGQILRVTRRAAGKGSVTLTLDVDAAATTAALDESRAQTSAILAQSKRRDPGGNVSL